MIQLAITPAARTVPTPGAAARVPATGLFALALTDFLGASTGQNGPPAGTPRHETTDDGTALPAVADGGAKDPPDPAFAWLPIALPPPPPPQAPAAPALAVPATPPGTRPAQDGAAAPLPPAPQLALPTPLTDIAAAPTMPVASAGAGTIATLPAVPVHVGTTVATSSSGMPPEVKRGPVVDQRPPPPPVASTGAAPLRAPPFIAAAHVFATALQTAAEERAGEHSTAKDPAESRLGVLAATDGVRNAVAAVSDARQAPLDMGQSHWPQKMIEHIEALRDAADAADTRIRLVPDALGTIDVAVRRDGGAVHVHFAAEQAATRTLLSDAQPRLAELAADRGWKLGDGSVDAGDSHPHHHAPHHPELQPAPRPLSPAVITDPAIAADGRVA